MGAIILWVPNKTAVVTSHSFLYPSHHFVPFWVVAKFSNQPLVTQSLNSAYLNSIRDRDYSCSNIS